MNQWHRQVLAAAVGVASMTSTAASQAGSSLFFSEYVEGSSYNKSLEIYNATDRAVDLSQYRIAVYFNGSTDAGTTIDLQGTLAPGDTFVFADSKADSAVLAAADQTYGGSLFNGNDAVALVHNGSPVDVIGQIGFDPGSAWGSGSTSTGNHTLRRDPGTTAGRTDGNSAFDPAQQWSGYPQDSFAGLGSYGGSGGGSVVAFGNCGDDATAIHDIQGDAANSPLSNETHVVEAIVTARFQGADGLDGFFVQAADSEADNNPQTSEGLFVYVAGADGPAEQGVAVGSRVRLRGQVAEYHKETELRGVDRLTICGRGYAVEPALLSLPFASAGGPESLEGMRVAVRQKLTVSGNYALGRYGEVTLSAGGRLATPTNVVAPGIQARALAAVNERNRLVLDDGSSVENPDPVVFPQPRLSAFNTLRVGDTVTGVQGVLRYGFGDWRIEPTDTPMFDPVNARPGSASLPTGGNMRVASANVLNYFNGDGKGSGFPTARGADTAAELRRQQAKLVAAITTLDADVIGLMEIENDGYGPDSAIRQLVDRLNRAATSGTRYDFVDPGSARLGGDAIAVGLIYDTARVTPVGAPATLAEPPFDTGNRQPLAQTFQLASGARLTVVVNHFKSKGSCPENDGLNAAQGDGQGCWNTLRTQAAERESQWLGGDPTAGATPNVLVIGDLNAYMREEPIGAFEKAGYTALLDDEQSLPGYTYVFDAQSGALDHALSSPALTKQVMAAESFHINADEPPALDYNSEYQSPGQVAQFYNAGPYRASDHDPVVVEMSLIPPTDSTAD